jgi:hypothetical protein
MNTPNDPPIDPDAVRKSVDSALADQYGAVGGAWPTPGDESAPTAAEVDAALARAFGESGTSPRQVAVENQRRLDALHPRRERIIVQNPREAA